MANPTQQTAKHHTRDAANDPMKGDNNVYTRSVRARMIFSIKYTPNTDAPKTDITFSAFCPRWAAHKHFTAKYTVIAGTQINELKNAS